MFDIKETRLLKHPTVEKALKVMFGFFADDENGDAFARHAIKTAELMTTHAQTPDPDAIAACVLMDGMIIRYEAQQFAASVSPKAADYLEKFYNLDPENPAGATPAEQQVLLAASIQGLAHIARVIADPDFYDAENGIYQDYRRVKEILDTNQKALDTLLPITSEQNMAALALEKFTAAQDALTAKVKEKQAELAFDKTGLPDHPFVRDVYAYMLADNLQTHPMGGYVDTNTRIAKVLVETGATQDPEVIGAALLNQHYAKEPDALSQKFSPFMAALFNASSPWARFGTEAEEQAPSPEVQRFAAMITHAHHLSFLEESLAHYPLYKERMEKDSLYGWLEDLESLTEKVKAGAAEEPHAGLKTRMEQAVTGARWLMYVPENKAIRAPGTPKRERGW